MGCGKGGCGKGVRNRTDVASDGGEKKGLAGTGPFVSYYGPSFADFAKTGARSEFQSS